MERMCKSWEILRGTLGKSFKNFLRKSISIFEKNLKNAFRKISNFFFEKLLKECFQKKMNSKRKKFLNI